MRTGKSVIPDGMNARDFIAEVCVPALRDAAWDHNEEAAYGLWRRICDALDEALSDQKPTKP